MDFVYSRSGCLDNRIVFGECDRKWATLANLERDLDKSIMVSTKKSLFFFYFFNGVLKFVLITILDAEFHAILAENTKL